MSADSQKKRILLTGATGFLGSHLLEALLKEGYQVVILKRSTSDTWRIAHLLEQVKSYDVDRELLVSVFSEQKIDVTIHLATFYRKSDHRDDIRQMIDSNVTFPLEVLECGLSYGCKSFINTGTFFECDCSTLPLREDAPIKPFNFYAKTKLAFETVLATYATQMASITLRLFSPYGEKDNAKLIPTLIQKALRDENIELSDGLQKLDFIFAADIVDAYLKALKNIFDTKHGHSVFNVGSGAAISVRELVSILEQQMGTTIKKTWGSPSAVDIPAVFADIRKAEAVLNWSPKTSIHEGLAKTTKYYMESARR